MKRLLGILALVALIGGTAEASPFKSRLAGAQPANLLMEDDSREIIVDLNGNGVLDVGDELIGFAKIAQTSPPPAAAGNQIYAIFAQKIIARAVVDNLDGSYTVRDTIGAATVNTMAHLTGAATSAGSMIAIIDKAGGFTLDGATAVPTLPTLALAGGTALNTDFLAFFKNAAGTGLVDEGTVQATMGLVNADDFFAFRSEDIFPLAAPTIYGDAGGLLPGGFGTIAGVIPGIPTSIQLGSFGGGLTTIDNFMTHVEFNEVVLSNRGSLHEWVILNGNLGGTFEGLDGGGLPVRTQDGLPDFLNNADLVTNATVVPEPASMILWSLMGVLGLGYFRRRNRK